MWVSVINKCVTQNNKMVFENSVKKVFEYRYRYFKQVFIDTFKCIWSKFFINL